MSTRSTSPLHQVPQNTPFASGPNTRTSTQDPTPGKPGPLDMGDNSPSTLSSFMNTLLPTASLSLPPPKPRHSQLTPQIASALLHPTLEATLHILNHDLPSAHFLVRHMQAPPAVEGMFLHSILHRCEGDMGNARIWLSDVGDICRGWVPKKRGEEKLSEEVWEESGLEGEGKGLLEWVYGVEGWEEEGKKLIDDVEGFRKGKAGREREGERQEIEERTRREMERVLDWCTRKFGDGEWVDASSAWVRPGVEVRETGNDMVSGSKGYRKF